MVKKALEFLQFTFNVLLLFLGTSEANFLQEIEFSTETYSSNPDVFKIRRHTDVAGCVQECRESAGCKFINFSWRSNICVMNFFTSVGEILHAERGKAEGIATWLKHSNYSVSLTFHHTIMISNKLEQEDTHPRKPRRNAFRYSPFITPG